MSFLDCPLASQSFEFWKNYEKNASSKIKQALTKVAKNTSRLPQHPQMLKDCFQLLGI